jgi:membrane protein
VRDLLAFLGIELIESQCNSNHGNPKRQLERKAQQTRARLTETLEELRAGMTPGASMSTNDGVHRSATTGVTLSEHAPLWAIGLSALLVALGFARRRSGDASPVTGDRRSLEVGRGRSAETPSQIPARGWKDILLRVYQGISDNRILLVAAGVTFYSLLAIFPGIAALISIYGLFADPATVAGHLDTIASVAPGGAVDVLREQMTRLASQGGTTLGISFVVSLAISFWTANSGVKAIFDALNIVYGEEEKRGFLKLNAITLSVTLGIVAFILLTLAAIVAVPVALAYIPIPGVTALVVKISRWPILFALVTTALAVLYKYGPSRTEPRWRWITWGSVSAAIVWLAASVLFSWYVASFGSYNKTYGSLGAVIGFMTWIWISIIVVLVGAKLNAEMEHQTVRESTTGQPKPIGRRGARMADTVGAAQD